jgi:hypothetical protein
MMRLQRAGWVAWSGAHGLSHAPTHPDTFRVAEGGRRQGGSPCPAIVVQGAASSAHRAVWCAAATPEPYDSNGVTMHTRCHMLRYLRGRYLTGAGAVSTPRVANNEVTTHPRRYCSHHYAGHVSHGWSYKLGSQPRGPTAVATALQPSFTPRHSGERDERASHTTVGLCAMCACHGFEPRCEN